jgi:hypothetical protein
MPNPPPSECPVCGADVPRAARACPECGADERAGWDEEAARGDGLDLPESDDGSRPAPATGGGRGRLVAAVAVVLALALILALLPRR